MVPVYRVRIKVPVSVTGSKSPSESIAVCRRDRFKALKAERLSRGKR